MALFAAGDPGCFGLDPEMEERMGETAGESMKMGMEKAMSENTAVSRGNPRRKEESDAKRKPVIGQWELGGAPHREPRQGGGEGGMLRRCRMPKGGEACSMSGARRVYGGGAGAGRRFSNPRRCDEAQEREWAEGCFGAPVR